MNRVIPFTQLVQVNFHTKLHANAGRNFSCILCELPICGIFSLLAFTFCRVAYVLCECLHGPAFNLKHRFKITLVIIVDMKLFLVTECNTNLAAARVFLATMNIQTYDTAMMRNDTKLRNRKMKTEYSQPGGFSGVMCSAKHTPEKNNSWNQISPGLAVSRMKPIFNFIVSKPDLP